MRLLGSSAAIIEYRFREVYGDRRHFKEQWTLAGDCTCLAT